MALTVATLPTTYRMASMPAGREYARWDEAITTALGGGASDSAGASDRVFLPDAE